jgi:ElaB/YqjD/DUF883 family membrane-anchored ribosome-binding protein
MSIASDIPTPAQAEAEAEQVRSELVDTLSQLRENLAPSNMVDEVLTNAKVSASDLSERAWDTARQNPIPALMIGAGLAMILGRGQRAQSGARLKTEALASCAGPERGPEFSSHIAQSEGLSHRRDDRSTLDNLGSSLATAKDQAGDLLSSANDKLMGAASRGARLVGDAFRTHSSTGGQMSSYSGPRDRIASSFSRLIEEQPLLLAALGVAAGFAIGAAVPRTTTEDKLMGGASASVRDAAQGLARDQYAQLRSTAEHAVEEIKQTVADHGVTSENLSGLVQDVGEKAKAAASEAGKTLDPTV